MNTNLRKFSAAIVTLLIITACNISSAPPLQQTADALAATIGARASAPAVVDAPTETLAPAQSNNPIVESPLPPAPNPIEVATAQAAAMMATLAAQQGGQPGFDPAMATQIALQGGLPPGMTPDPALATQMALQGGQPGGGSTPVDPAIAAQIAYATQMALEGKPIDPALITAAAQTQAAGGGPNPATATAQAAAFAPILAELPQYGVDPARGRPGWTHAPVTLETQGNDQFTYANDYIQVIAQDFVVSADITWNTRYGDSGCGFVLRSDGQENSANQYIAVITRGAQGHMIFSVMVNGKIASGREVYANGIDPRFEWQNDTTNRLTIVGRGNSFVVYTNGTRVGEFDPRDEPPTPRLPPRPTQPPGNNPVANAAYQRALAEYEANIGRLQSQYQARLKLFRESDVVYENGFIAMVAATDAGYTRCQFTNAWLWLID